MSGRRRRDDGWDDGRLDAQQGRRDIWADDSVGEWGGRDADVLDGASRSRQPSGGGGAAYGGGAGGQAYQAPDYPSFQAAGSSSSDDRYRRGSGDGGQRGSSGYDSSAYSADGYMNAGYGGSQSAGYGRGSGSGGGSSAGRRDGAGYDAAYGGGSGSPNGYGSSRSANDGGYGRSGFSPEFMPVEDDDMDDDGSAGTPRPYGRLSIYTLREDMTREFDRIAERAAEGVRTAEPDTLVYVIHVVPKAPQQRIIYEIYRDRAAFMSHERQPHIRQFAADRASCVLATNIIDLRLKYAKVAALGSPSDAAAQAQAQPSRSQRQEPAAQGIQYSPTSYTPTPQYSSSQPPGQAASFTPAGGDASRQGYSQAPQYGSSGTGAYGAGNGQYDAANSNGYSGAAGYSNGASYSSNGYPSPNAYQGTTGYSGDNGYSGANGYQSSGGYSSTNGYANGTNGYQGVNGYANGSGYSNDGSGGYGAAGGYADGGSASYSASASTQYTPRYRELTSGTSTDLGAAGYGQQPSEWDQRSQGYRQ